MRIDGVSHIESLDHWAELKSQAENSHGLVVFKHSPICPVSASAQREFDTFCQSLDGESKVILAQVDVIASRPISQHIAQELSVTHQSPQLLWCASDMSVSFHASHYDISSSDLQQRYQALDSSNS